MRSLPASGLGWLQALVVSFLIFPVLDGGNFWGSGRLSHIHSPASVFHKMGSMARNQGLVLAMAEQWRSSPNLSSDVSSTNAVLTEDGESLGGRRRILQSTGAKIMLGAIVEDPESEELIPVMQMAVDNLNKNASSLFAGAELSLRALRPARDQYEVAISTLDFLQGSEVAIIGPTFSSSVRIMSTFATAAHVPTVSPSASDPSLSDKSAFPFFLRTMCSDDLQMQAIANLVNFFNWTEIVAVHVNDEYGLGGIQALDAHLTNTRSRIVTRMPIQFEATGPDMLQLLQQVRNRTESTVFVVHIQITQVRPFFDAVIEAQMLGDGFVWLTTEAIVQALAELVEMGDDITTRLEGLVGTQVARPNSPELDDFMKQWKARNLTGTPGLYDLRSYDAVQLVGRAIAEGLANGQLSQADLTASNSGEQLARPWSEVHQESALLASGLRQNSLTSLGVRVVGAALRNLTLALGMSGIVPALSGSVRLDANGDNVGVEFEVVNIMEGNLSIVGSWSMADGLVLSSEYKVEKGGPFPRMTWPGRPASVPSGWLPNSGRVLRVAVPIETFSPFVIYNPDKPGNQAFTGEVIETFQAALNMLPYQLNYQFLPFTGAYNDLCEAVDRGEYDLGVGDISITDFRSKIVDFTQQFQSAGLVVVAPLSRRHNLGWAFLEPFTWDMWVVLVGMFLFVALAIWWLERGTEGELSVHVKPRKAFGRAIWWSYTTLFFAHAAIVRTPLGRIVGGLWLFVVLIVVASYQANLTSTLTVQQLQPTVQGIASIIQSTSLTVGTSNTSWYREALLTLGVPESRIIPLRSDFEDYKAKLSGRYGGCDAIVDELPYAQLFTGQNCEYGIVGQEFYKGGWGWPFPQGSRLQQAMSTAILQLSKDGTLYKLRQKWVSSKGACGDAGGSSVESNRLGLPALGPLFIILLSIAAVSCAIILVIRLVDSWWVSRQRPPPQDLKRMSSRASTRASTDLAPDTERGDDEEEGGGADKERVRDDGESTGGGDRERTPTTTNTGALHNLSREGTMGTRRARPLSRLASWHPRHIWLSRALDHQDSGRL